MSIQLVKDFLAAGHSVRKPKKRAYTTEFKELARKLLLGPDASGFRDTVLATSEETKTRKYQKTVAEYTRQVEDSLAKADQSLVIRIGDIMPGQDVVDAALNFMLGAQSDNSLDPQALADRTLALQGLCKLVNPDLHMKSLIS